MGGEDVKIVHQVADVRTVLVDYTDGHGKRMTELAFVMGEQVVLIPNKGAVAQAWLKDAVLKKLPGKKGEPESV